MTNNQGIYHMRHAGHVACKSRNAIMALDPIEFVTATVRKCKRCEAYKTKMYAAQAKKQARLDREYVARLAS